MTSLNGHSRVILEVRDGKTAFPLPEWVADIAAVKYVGPDYPLGLLVLESPDSVSYLELAQLMFPPRDVETAHILMAAHNRLFHHPLWYRLQWSGQDTLIVHPAPCNEGHFILSCSERAT